MSYHSSRAEHSPGKFSDLKSLFLLDHEEKQKTPAFFSKQIITEELISLQEVT